MKLRISERVEQKLWSKHRVSFFEVEEVMLDPRRSTSRTKSQDRYPVREVVGRTGAGRYLLVVLILKPGGVWVMSARDADTGHKKRYTGK